MQNDNNKEKKTERISWKYLIHEITHLFHFESGYFFTVKELFIRPGIVMNEFLFYDRNKYVKPIVYLIFNSVIFSLVLSFCKFNYDFFTLNASKSKFGKYLEVNKLNDWLNSHIGYNAIIIGLVMSLWLLIFFRKRKLNYFENVVLLCYSFAQALIILSVFIVIAKLTSLQIIINIGYIFSLLYLIWSLANFYDSKKVLNYVKILVCCYITLLTYQYILYLFAYIAYLVK